MTANTAPSPFDGYVHQLTEMRVENGARRMTVACGAEMPAYVRYGPLGGAAAFPSEVTCPPCQARLRVPHPAYSSG